jgi:phage terminase large subunit-like protein
VTPEEATEMVRAASIVEGEADRRDRYRFNQFFPDCTPDCQAESALEEDHAIRPGYQTPICRTLYRKHLEHFRAGLVFPERLLMAANRIGKTEGGSYEVTCHLTGKYPHWWQGRRFEHPTDWWAAGSTSKTTRDILQVSLLGPLGRERDGLGMVPLHLIADKTPKAGVPDAFETLWVQHAEKVHGAPSLSMLQFKSYDQGRRAFDGTAKDGIWLDEEPPEDVVGECQLRTMTKRGIVIITFTPLQGLTTFVKDYIDTAVMADGQGYVPARGTFFAEAEVD